MVKKNRLIALLIAFLTVFSIPATMIAQPGTWATSAGSSGRDYISDLIVDDAGNTYVSGYFTDSIEFDGTKLIGQGQNDVFIAKYNPTGQLAWVQQFGWYANEFTRTMAFDWDGSILLVGDYQDSTIVGNDTIRSGDTLWYGPQALTFDVFITKLDPATGNVQRTYADGWFSSERIWDLEVDNMARRILAVTWHSFSWWDYGHRGKGFHDAMIVALDSSADLNSTNNNLRFSMRSHAYGKHFDEAREVEVLGDSLYVLAGTFQDTCFFRDSTIFGVTDFEDDIYLTSHDDTAGYIWSLTGGSPAKDRITGMVQDPAGNLYISGTFEGTFTMGGQSATGVDKLDGFIAKVDKDGNAIWISAYGGAGFDAIEGITYRTSGDLVVTGYFQGEMTLGGVTLQASDSLDQDAFVAAIDPATGSVTWSWQGGGSGLDLGHSVETDASNNVYVLGTYNNTATFGLASLTSEGSDDIFLLRMTPDGSVSTPEQDLLASNLTLYPNPAGDRLKVGFELAQASPVQLTLVDLSGLVVFREDMGKKAPGKHVFGQDLSQFAPGMYFLRLESKGLAATKKLVIAR